MRGLMMGRFQPFHLGHLDLVKQILTDCDEIIIAVTASQFNYISKDPFTAGERVEMIHDSLKDAGVELSRCFIIPIENQINNSTWGSFLKSTLPKFDKVYSGNEYVNMLLTNSDFSIISPNFLNRTNYNSSNIRNLIAKDQDWEKLVPNSVASYIKKLDGIKRIKTIFGSDTKPQEF